ncbi:LexA family protein [Paenibacillus sp. GCM10023250]|uniref:LexA family protein n=1 Tax=Paenibacillus sp. GCM10023250 TaxID=3252648 RepID=UPI00361E5089
MSLSRKCLEIAYSILNFSAKQGFPPTVDEVRNFVGLRSFATLEPHLLRLRQEGILHWEPSESRSLRVLRAEFVKSAYLERLAEERAEYIYRAP